MNEWTRWMNAQYQKWEREYGYYTIEELKELFVYPDDLDHYFNCWLAEKIKEKRQLTNF